MASPARRAVSLRLSVSGPGVTKRMDSPAGSALAARHRSRHGRHDVVTKSRPVRGDAASHSIAWPAGSGPSSRRPGSPTLEGLGRPGGTTDRRMRPLQPTAGRVGASVSTAPSPACKSAWVRIGVLGATGPAGQAVAVQFAGIGIEVVIGSRAVERAEETVAALQERWGGRNLPLTPGDNEAAAGADLVVVATPWEGVIATVTALEEHVAGKVVISMANALTRWGKEMVPLLPPTGSVSVAVARALPRSRVVGAFHHLPAGPWGDLDHLMDADVMVFGDDRAATAEVIDLIDRLPGLRGVDSGGLGSGLAVEALTPALLEVNRRYKTHAAIRITGLPGRQVPADE